MSDSQENLPTTTPPRRSGAKAVRIIALILLLAAIAAAFALLIFTQRGQEVVHNPRLLRGEVVRFVRTHPLSSPLVYMSVYVILGVLALPVWWLQILGGCAFGLPLGVLYSQIAAVISAVTSARFCHWLAADWFHKIEDRLTKLKRLDETFGHNGLLVVMAVRLTHVVPFGISNYCFGLTTVSWRDVAWGTLLGGIPAVSVYVAIGTQHHPLRDWRFLVGLAVVHVLLLIPLIVHYARRESGTS